MKSKLNPDLNAASLSELKLGRNFMEQARQMRINTFGDIAALEPKELISRNGFSYHWLVQLTKALNERGWIEMLQRPTESTGD